MPFIIPESWAILKSTKWYLVWICSKKNYHEKKSLNHINFSIPWEKRNKAIQTIPLYSPKIVQRCRVPPMRMNSLVSVLKQHYFVWNSNRRGYFLFNEKQFLLLSCKQSCYVPMSLPDPFEYTWKHSRFSPACQGAQTSGIFIGPQLTKAGRVLRALCTCLPADTGRSRVIIAETGYSF